MKKNLVELSKKTLIDENEINYIENFQTLEYFIPGSVSSIFDRKLPSREVRENDVDYQRSRTKVYTKLFQRYPSSTRDVPFSFFLLFLYFIIIY